MPQQLRIDETIVSRVLETEIIKNLGIPSQLPDVERVVSVNARVEISSIELETGSVVINGIIRATVYYASQDDPSDVISVRRNFTFSDRIAVAGARRGLDADAEVLITDIDFNVVNNRTIGLEFTLTIDLDLTAPDTVPLIEEREDVDIRRERFRIQRSIRERNYTRELVETIRIDTDMPNIRRVVDVDNSIQISEITTNYDRVRVRGIIDSDLLYVDQNGQLEYEDLTYGFNESFSFTGVTPDMDAYVETNIISEEVELIDRRRVRITSEVIFTILVIEEELVEIPTDIVSPVDRVSPVRRNVIVERVVVEERTRVSARDRVTIPQGNPDIARVISASGNIRGGSIEVDAQNGGVLVSGVIDANIIYVADLEDQPVYFAPATVTFSTFIDIPEVETDMQAYADIDLNRITASGINEREISVRAILDVNLLVTERVRVPVITSISDRPTQQPEQPAAPAPGQQVTYVVQSGDTLYLIAQKFSVTVDRIISVNNITNPGNLQVGQRLIIPGD
ncbi:MAG: SPOCS domain-containing protein [Halanaerobiales bacterium]